MLNDHVSISSVLDEQKNCGWKMGMVKIILFIHYVCLLNTQIRLQCRCIPVLFHSHWDWILSKHFLYAHVWFCLGAMNIGIIIDSHLKHIFNSFIYTFFSFTYTHSFSTVIWDRFYVRYTVFAVIWYIHSEWLSMLQSNTFLWYPNLLWRYRLIRDMTKMTTGMCLSICEQRSTAETHYVTTIYYAKSSSKRTMFSCVCSIISKTSFRIRSFLSLIKRIFLYILSAKARWFCFISIYLCLGDW